MKKHMYRAVAVEKIRPTELHEKASEGRLTFGCDAAKEDWKAAFMDSERRVVSVIAFKIPKDLETVLGLLSELRELGRGPVDGARTPWGPVDGPEHGQLQRHLPRRLLQGLHLGLQEALEPGLPAALV